VAEIADHAGDHGSRFFADVACVIQYGYAELFQRSCWRLNSSANVGVPQKSKSGAAALRSGGTEASDQLRAKSASEFYDRLSAQWRLTCPDLQSSSHDYWAFLPS